MFVVVFSTVTLVFCWLWGDVSLVTKLIFTGLFLASFALILTDLAFLFIAVHCCLVAVFGAATFGMEWLNQRR